MGFLDAIKGKADDMDKTYNPLRKVGDAIEAAGKNIGKPPDPQADYEAREKAMNRNNPHFQNVDKPVTFEPMKVKGNP